MAAISPLKARDAALKQALTDHAARLAAARHLSAEDRRVMRSASILTYRCECDAAHAVYDCAWRAITRSAIAYDRAAYEGRHGTLDGYLAWRSEDTASARAEMSEDVL